MKLRLSLLLCLAPLLASLPVQAQSNDCDRGCLKNLLGQYLEALLVHDYRQAPLASTYRHTENSVVKPLGDGMWQSATALGDIERYYYDPVTRNAVFYGIIKEGDERAVVSLRIQVDKQQISEAEWFIGREDDPGPDGVPGSVLWDADHLTSGNPPPIRTVPPEQRSSREELIHISNSYWDAVVNRDPTVAQAHAGCFRDENGQPTTGNPLPVGRRNDGGLNGLSDCRSGTSTFNVLNVAARRWAVVDEVAQVVVASGVFVREPGNYKRRNHFSDVFYIDDDKLRGIYTAMYYPNPLRPVPNWPPYDGNFPLAESFGATE